MDGRQRPGRRWLGMGAVRIKNRAMTWTVELPGGRIVLDRAAGVGAGLLNGHEVAITQMDQPARLAIGGIGEAHRAVGGLGGMSNHRPRRGRCHRWRRGRRWLRRVRWGRRWSRRLRWGRRWSRRGLRSRLLMLLFSSPVPVVPLSSVVPLFMRI